MLSGITLDHEDPALPIYVPLIEQLVVKADPELAEKTLLKA